MTLKILVNYPQVKLDEKRAVDACFTISIDGGPQLSIPANDIFLLDKQGIQSMFVYLCHTVNHIGLHPAARDRVVGNLLKGDCSTGFIADRLRDVSEQVAGGDFDMSFSPRAESMINSLQSKFDKVRSIGDGILKLENSLTELERRDAALRVDGQYRMKFTEESDVLPGAACRIAEQLAPGQISRMEDLRVSSHGRIDATPARADGRAIELSGLSFSISNFIRAIDDQCHDLVNDLSEATGAVNDLTRMADATQELTDTFNDALQSLSENYSHTDTDKMIRITSTTMSLYSVIHDQVKSAYQDMQATHHMSDNTTPELSGPGM